MLLLPLGASAAPKPIDPSTKFFVPAPSKDALKQVAGLLKQRQVKSALQVTAMLAQGHAVWFDEGSAAEVQRSVRQTMAQAAFEHRVPVLVAYNLPFRDCGQYSTGGALNTADYLNWIDGFAKGIGSGKAIVILEPDGLGIIPYTTTLDGRQEWCQPDLTGTGLTPATAHSERYVQVNGAVDRLEQQPNVSVYLDGTHPAWLGVGEAAYRLMQAGLDRAQGFFVNASNYQTTQSSATVARWISGCVAQVETYSWYMPGWCPSQYNPATGYTLDLSPAYAAIVDAQYATMAPPVTHFVIDTGRNGLGPWTPPAGVYSDPQDWCNPPNRGAGLRPTANTGNPLIDAYLWIKVPGESDGSCTRGTAGPADPARGMVDPAAGVWFPQQALELAKLASPPLLH